MTVNPISSNIVNLLTNQQTDTQKTDGAGGFADIFNELIQSVEATDEADKASLLQLMTNESDSLSGLMIDSQKAELSLNLALQIRNKVLDAYKEIMSMQV